MLSKKSLFLIVTLSIVQSITYGAYNFAHNNQQQLLQPSKPSQQTQPTVLQPIQPLALISLSDLEDLQQRIYAANQIQAQANATEEAWQQRLSAMQETMNFLHATIRERNQSITQLQNENARLQRENAYFKIVIDDKSARIFHLEKQFLI